MRVDGRAGVGSCGVGVLGLASEGWGSAAAALVGDPFSCSDSVQSVSMGELLMGVVISLTISFAPVCSLFATIHRLGGFRFTLTSIFNLIFIELTPRWSRLIPIPVPVDRRLLFRFLIRG